MPNGWECGTVKSLKNKRITFISANDFKTHTLYIIAFDILIPIKCLISVIIYQTTWKSDYLIFRKFLQKQYPTFVKNPFLWTF